MISRRHEKTKMRMTMNEIMTIVITFLMSHHRDFKNYYLGYVPRCYQKSSKLSELH